MTPKWGGGGEIRRKVGPPGAPTNAKCSPEQKCCLPGPRVPLWAAASADTCAPQPWCSRTILPCSRSCSRLPRTVMPPPNPLRLQARVVMRIPPRSSRSRASTRSATLASIVSRSRSSCSPDPLDRCRRAWRTSRTLSSCAAAGRTGPGGQGAAGWPGSSWLAREPLVASPRWSERASRPWPGSPAALAG